MHNKRVDCTVVHAIPLALATLSTTAAAINSVFVLLALIRGLPGLRNSPVTSAIQLVPPRWRQEYHMLYLSPARHRHNIVAPEEPRLARCAANDSCDQNGSPKPRYSAPSRSPEGERGAREYLYIRQQASVN